MTSEVMDSTVRHLVLIRRRTLNYLAACEGQEADGALMGMLDGEVAVIAGGTSGIGASAAELFVREGARIVIAGRRRERGEELAAKLGTAASFIRTDVSIEQDVAAMIKQAVDRFGRLDCLFNNAGDASTADGIANIDIESFNAAIALHVGGALLGMKYAAPIMMRQKSGSIINTASVNGTRAGYITLAYATAKAAVIHLTRCVAVELGPHGVRVNSLSHGPVVTGIFGKARGIDPDLADRNTEPARSAIEAFVSKVQPLCGIAEPDDIAKVALFLASDASRFITAQDLVVDGGITAGRTQSEMMASFVLFQMELRPADHCI
jgi:NAD(P)-dependent dehydrogenase (short-subunit alcohol dehydrogenase family)